MKLSSDLTELLSATFISGSENDGDGDICISPSGDVYITGRTESNDFPVTPGAYCTDFPYNMENIYVSCFDPDLTNLQYSTFIGGTNIDFSKAIVCDDIGNVYITGHTRSNNYPTTPGAYDETFNTVINAGDSFITKFDPTLTNLLSSTYLGSTNGDFGTDLEFDSDGVLHITGSSGGSNFPTTPSAYCDYNSGLDDIFVSKMDEDLCTLIYSTLFGGSSRESDLDPSMKIASNGSIYIVGSTTSDDLPITPGAFDPTYESSMEGFIVKFDSELSEVVACSYAGDWGTDYLCGVTLDVENNLYACGATIEGFNLITENSYLVEIDPNDGFQGLVMKLAPDLDYILAGTYLGGTESDFAYDIFFLEDNIIIYGKTFSSDFPVTPGAFKTESIGADRFISILDPDLSSGTSVEENDLIINNQITCYPNPFNPETNIQFTISENDTDTRVVIYNSRGQKIKELVNDKYNTGTYSVRWEGLDDAGKSVSSGIYFYKMITDKLSVSKKMILMK